MPLSPTLSPQISSTSPYLTAQATIDQLQDDLLDLDIAVPSSKGNERAGKRSPRPSGGGKRGSKKKGLKLREPVEGECHLLKLPVDLLQTLLARFPPRSLSVLSATCKTLREDLEDDTIWRQSYVNRFMGDVKPDDVKVLVQPSGTESRGWRKEALAREAMLGRWTSSKAVPSYHHPPVGLIHALSLSYPPYAPPPPKLVVGKASQTPTKASSSVPPVAADSPETPKMTHRQKYEALLASTTRPAPYILSASLAAGGVVRSDPISGKVTKGYWGPGRDANFHLRPHLDHSSPPTAVHLSVRQQRTTIWGLLTGTVVHTTMGMKSHASQGGRASSVNVYCKVDDAHEGEVRCVWAEEDGDGHWVSSGEDGKVKFWRLNPAELRPGSGKKSPAGEPSGTVQCLFTSKPPTEPLENRSDIVKLRTAQRPDPVTLARCNAEYGIVCGVTKDGDLRVWFDVPGRCVEVRVDVGSEQDGGVLRLELDAISPDKSAVLVHHERSPLFCRYDIDIDGMVKRTEYHCFGSITAMHISLKPASAVAQPSPPPIAVLGEDSDDLTPVRQHDQPVFGRCIITGDEYGAASIFPWEAAGEVGSVEAIRTWHAANKKITAIDANCSIVAIGSCDGYIKIYDPLSPSPTLLRSFHANHLSSADSAVASSTQFDALFYTVNQIILENDLVVASIGRKVFCWRAGSGKKRDPANKGRGGGGGVGFRGGSRAVDMRSAQLDAEDDHLALQLETTPTRLQQRQSTAIRNMGLEDADEAVQYAMMLSLEQSRAEAEGISDESDGEAEALEAVRRLEEEERREREEVLEVVRMAEMRGQ